MMARTHALWGVAATSLIAGTASPVHLGIAAVASQLPDVDTSQSYVGRVLLPISRFLETRFPHRTVTHSFLATVIVVLLALPVWFFSPLAFKAICWGYFFGWFSDVFTKSGVAAFYPLTSARLVVPGNPRFRLSSGTKGEYVVIAVLVVIVAASIHFQTKGGLMRVFNTALGQPDSVVKLFQTEGARHQIIAQLEGRFAAAGAPVRGEFVVVDVSGETLLLRATDGVLYQAGRAQSCPTCQIHVERVKGKLGPAQTVATRELAFQDRRVGDVLLSINVSAGAQISLSGELRLQDAELLSWPVSLQHFNSVTVSGEAVKTLKLQAATLADLERASDFYADGQLLIREVSNVR